MLFVYGWTWAELEQHDLKFRSLQHFWWYENMITRHENEKPYEWFECLCVCVSNMTLLHTHESSKKKQHLQKLMFYVCRFHCANGIHVRNCNIMKVDTSPISDVLIDRIALEVRANTHTHTWNCVFRSLSLDILIEFRPHVDNSSTMKEYSLKQFIAFQHISIE